MNENGRDHRPFLGRAREVDADGSLRIKHFGQAILREYRAPVCFALAEDCHGNIWFGDRDTGAWRYDGKALVNFAIDEKLGSQMILDIYEDKSQNLVFAMAQGGVYQFNGSTFVRRF